MLQKDLERLIYKPNKDLLVNKDFFVYGGVSVSLLYNSRRLVPSSNTLVFVSILKYSSNMIPAVRKIVPEFITSLDCKGLVGKVDGTVTHIIVSTKEELEEQRTLKSLQGVASGVMMVPYLWVEACLVNRNNMGKADKWEATDKELMGANVPWRASKRREENLYIDNSQRLVQAPRNLHQLSEHHMVGI